MTQFSISFTVGKASDPNSANISHNNREFFAKNIDPTRSPDNIVFACEPIKSAYEKLFGEALAAYNAKQRQPCRRIQDYYEHIAGGKREEPFYEAVVQFGDSRTTPCGSDQGMIAKEMLTEYMQAFQKRNQNLYVFNAVLHMDEASPHLHIDFVPFYTKERKHGLPKGVSMRAALEEMGFAARSRFDSAMMGWEQSERIEMEKVLMQHGFKREDKHAHYAHMTVAEYKREQDTRRAADFLRKQRKHDPSLGAMARSMKLRIAELTKSIDEMKHDQLLPYKSFFYTDRDKQIYVQTEMEQKHIPFRQTENGFEAQQCHVDTIRKIEQSYKAKPVSARDKLRENIDRYLPLSKDIFVLMAYLVKAGYDIKYGKYIAFRFMDSTNFIRLRSLGTEYSETALKMRIKSNQQFEQKLEAAIAKAQENSSENAVVLRAMRLYTVAVKDGSIQPRKKNPDKAFLWANDPELDKLLALNRKINDGATLQTLRKDFADKDEAMHQKYDIAQAEKDDLRFALDLREKLELLYGGIPSKRFTRQQAEETLHQHPEITADNWRKVEILIANCQESAAKAADDLEKAEAELKEAADLYSLAERVYSGVHVQEMANAEKNARLAETVPNGTYTADTQVPHYVRLCR